MKPYGIIYIATNLVNGKKYIGQTIQTLEQRKTQHIRVSFKGCDAPFHKAIRKHGEENFKWEIIDKAFSKEELNSKETQWIKFHNTFANYGQGYNCDFGGNNTTVCEETRKKLSASHKGQTPWNKGKQVPQLQGHFVSDETKEKIRQKKLAYKPTDEHKKNISESKKGKNNPNFGKARTQETKDKIGKANSGANNGMYGKCGKDSPSAKAVIAYDFETKEVVGEFDAIVDLLNVLVSKTTGKKLGRGNVISVLKGRRKQCGGYYFEYKMAN